MPILECLWRSLRQWETQRTSNASFMSQQLVQILTLTREDWEPNGLANKKWKRSIQMSRSCDQPIWWIWSTKTQRLLPSGVCTWRCSTAWTGKLRAWTQKYSQSTSTMLLWLSWTAWRWRRQSARPMTWLDHTRTPIKKSTRCSSILRRSSHTRLQFLLKRHLNTTITLGGNLSIANSSVLGWLLSSWRLKLKNWLQIQTQRASRICTSHRSVSALKPTSSSKKFTGCTTRMTWQREKVPTTDESQTWALVDDF